MRFDPGYMLNNSMISTMFSLHHKTSEQQFSTCSILSLYILMDPQLLITSQFFLGMRNYFRQKM